MLLRNFILFNFHMQSVMIINLFLYQHFQCQNMYPIMSLLVLLCMDIAMSPRFENEIMDFRIVLHIGTVIDFMFHVKDVLSFFNFVYHTYRVYLDLQHTNHIIQERINRSNRYPKFLPYHGDRECYICLTDHNNLFQLTCSHTFHKECLQQWIDHSHTEYCPVCKKVFPP